MDLNGKFDWQDIDGWFNFTRLYDHIVYEASKNDVIVEVGTWLGRSTCYLATIAKHSEKNLKIIAVDHFKGSPGEPVLLQRVAASGGSIYCKFIDNMQRAEVLNELTVLPFESLMAAQTVQDGSVFAIFLDGSHIEEDVLADMKAWYPKLKPGGIFAGHDYHLPGVAQAVGRGVKELNIPGFQIYIGDGNVSWPSWYLRKPMA